MREGPIKAVWLLRCFIIHTRHACNCVSTRPCLLLTACIMPSNTLQRAIPVCLGHGRPRCTAAQCSDVLATMHPSAIITAIWLLPHCVGVLVDRSCPSRPSCGCKVMSSMATPPFTPLWSPQPTDYIFITQKARAARCLARGLHTVRGSRGATSVSSLAPRHLSEALHAVDARFNPCHV